MIDLTLTASGWPAARGVDSPETSEAGLYCSRRDMPRSRGEQVEHLAILARSRPLGLCQAGHARLFTPRQTH